ncbi:MAG: DHA2 family efflux MFS transporter permease subunit [Bifidobacterium tibiigranuli]|uniref:MFS transporter n=2 Tax=Bifidobacterium tibiigranuli TaxID=2172043 RepID=UPI002352F169|nr:MDR family MFS transporter [Bifidobacterium tibiigranuli]MCH3973992.1 DHA2 family efflux MFS transporter permease subunit [Bifidobacterium tibiigranuli]MCH4189794.1 DHA2 family efflux MFS transporter permease subunit [Bifidobacterium tibiigranuli]MCH4274511.1 DHA2 family efflux MFS transporter permease subunit [Bifidobacterium tibiigranuli]MCI1254355.1 DHA2 family efflux MFS transporter permease subunit [Bifidobacterium tibiigranuli]MCI1790840.1 DHA2 family efflux MFS transporter permease s
MMTNKNSAESRSIVDTMPLNTTALGATASKTTSISAECHTANEETGAASSTGGRMRRVFGFIAICLAMFVVMLDTTITNIALPDIMDSFRSTLNDASWISTVYVLGVSVLIIPMARIADQFGRKKVLTVGFVLFGAGSALCGAAGSLPFLIAMRALQSIGGAIVLPLAVPMGLAMFGMKRMQAISGVVGATTAVAAAGGPAIGGLLIQWFGWRSIFYVNVPFVLLAVVLCILCVDESYDDTASKRVDVLGMAFLAATLFLLTFALLKGKDYGWGSATVITMFAGSAICLAAFIVTELHVSAPMMEFSLFRELTFTASTISYFIGGFAIVCPALILNFFLQNVLGYTVLHAALITMWMSATVVIAMPLGNVVASKVGDARAVNLLGLLLLSLGCFLMARIGVDTSKTVMIADMVVFGFGLGLSAQSIITAVKHLPIEKSGMASGIVNSTRQIGTCLGIAILVTLLDANITTAHSAIESTALQTVSQSSLAPSVKSVASKDIRTLLVDGTDSGAGSGGGASATSSTDKLKRDLTGSINALQSTPTPEDAPLRTLYHGSQALGSSASKLAGGQDKLAAGSSTLANGISGLATGSVTLSGKLNQAADGSAKLSSGIDAYTAGVASAALGAATLNAKSGEALNSLASGASTLDAGAQQLLAQMSAGSATNGAAGSSATSGASNGSNAIAGSASGTTIRDGADALASGASQLSQRMAEYTNASVAMYYTMISANPNSAQLLKAYTAQLAALQTSCTKTATKAVASNCEQQIPMLSNLVALYTAGTSSGVTNESDFVKALQSQASASGQGSIVAAGSSITAATAELSKGADSLSSQFQPDGKFSQGIAALAQGAQTLDAGAAQARDQLHGGIGQLSNGLDRLNQSGSALQSASSSLSAGLTTLAQGSSTLGAGLASAQQGSSSLAEGSKTAARGGQALAEGTGKLTSGIGKVDQGKTLSAVFDSISDTKNNEISHAFGKVFTVAGIVLGLTSIIGIFTDRKAAESPESAGAASASTSN